MSRARWSRLALLVVLPACLTPSLAPCGDLLCPDGAICVANTVCALPEQLAACVSVADEGSCQTTQGTGHCVAGVCVGNVCGDGVVTGNEVCDGTELTVTCADFGFYAGDPACTPSCTVERAGCSGRCGDGVVQTGFGEQCDTAPPAEGCLDFGHDYGVLGCNSFCAPAITRDCERYGWETLLPASVEYIDAAASAHGVIGLNPTAIDIVWDGVASTRANPGWTKVVASANQFAAVGTSSIGWFDGQWHELAVGLAGDWFSLADDGRLFGGSASGCVLAEIDLATGAVTSVPAPPIPSCLAGIAFGHTELYVSQNFDGVRRWNGSAWSLTTGIEAAAIARAGPRILAALTSSTTRFIDVSVSPVTVTPSQLGGISTVVVYDDDGNQVRFDNNDGAANHFSLRAHGALFQLDGLDPAGQVAPARSADGRVITFGSGVRAMRPLAAATTLPLDTRILEMHLADDGVIACGSGLFVTGLAGFVERPYSVGGFGDCVEVTGSALGAHYVVASGHGVVAYNAGNNSYQDLILLNTVTSVAGDFTQLWTANGTELIGITSGDASTAVTATLPTGCSVVQVAMSAKRRFVGVGACNGKLAVFARTTTWTTLATSTVDAGAAMQIAIGDDDTVFVRLNNDVYRLDGTTFTLIGTGLRIAAVSHDDVFIEQGGEAMLHITAAQSQEIRLASGPFVASKNHLFSWDAVSRRMYGVARVPSQSNGP